MSGQVVGSGGRDGHSLVSLDDMHSEIKCFTWGQSHQIIDTKLTDIHAKVEQYAALEEFALPGMG